MGRKKELTIGPHLSVRRRGKRGTQAAAAAALGQRPAHAGEERRGEGDGLRCTPEGKGGGRGSPVALFCFFSLFYLLDFLLSYFEMV